MIVLQTALFFKNKHSIFTGYAKEFELITAVKSFIVQALGVVLQIAGIMLFLTASEYDKCLLFSEYYILKGAMTLTMMTLSITTQFTMAIGITIKNIVLIVSMPSAFMLSMIEQDNYLQR